MTHKSLGGTWFKQNPNFKVAFMCKSKIRKSFKNTSKDHTGDYIMSPLSMSQDSENKLKMNLFDLPCYQAL